MSNSAWPVFFAGIIVACSPFLLVILSYLGLVDDNTAVQGGWLLFFTIPLGGLMGFIAIIMSIFKGES